jgi:hypothetical protein
LITYRQESTDVGHVAHALSNGVRSDIEIAKTTRLALDRVHIALSILVRRRCVIGSPSVLFQLTDAGKDLIKIANAAERKRSVELRGRPPVFNHVVGSTEAPSINQDR